ncbi:MAG: transposase [Patescibacteria group bacterium]
MPAKNVIKEYQEKSYYHLYNRGVAKNEIFPDEDDYKTFLGYLKLYLSATNLQGLSLKVPPSHKLKNYLEQIKLLAYCLMPNHFHLLIYQQNSDDINFFMRSLCTKYSMYFNRKYHRVGHVFQGSYKGVLVSSEQQLVYLSKYIHRNPKELLPSRIILEGYKYSSYGNYLGLFNQPWIKTDDISNLFSRGNSYKSFVEETDERDLPTIKDLLIEEI